MAHDYFSGHSVQAETGRASTLLVGTLMGGVLAVSSYLAGSIYGGEFHSTALALAAAVLLGLPIVWTAVTSILRGELDMDVLVAIAVAAAFAGQQYQVTAVVAFFFHVSNLMEKRTALGAKPNQIVRVRPGDNIPADGVIITGESSVSQANITGESLPVDKRPDDEVFSGTINLSGTMDIRVSRVGADTTLGRVQELILQAEQTQMPIMRLMDRYAHWYVPTIIMLGLIVLFFTKDMDRLITMLIVACPCALILAMPTAMVAGLACAARLGILIKSVTDLELARTMSEIVLDKTGTLTTGELAVSRLRPAEGVEPDELVKAAASVEHRSRHPVARAVVEVARKANVTLDDPVEFQGYGNGRATEMGSAARCGLFHGLERCLQGA